jgi:enoyl-CoA hydratase/carnithine racemase
MTDELLWEQSGPVGTITLNRPDKLNAVTPAMLAGLDECLDRAEQDDTVRVLLITGAGRAFCAGADISRPQTTDLRALWARDARHTERQLRMWSFPKPTVVVIQGYCLGRGCEIALSCDIVVAEEDARIGEPEIRQGSVLSSIVPWMVGMQHAKRFLLTGDTFTGREAAAIGLVADVVPTGDGLERGRRLAERIAHIPPLVAAAVKRVVNTAYESAGMRAAVHANLLLAASLDGLSAEELGTAELTEIRRTQGMKAFLEARDGPFRAP